MNIVVPSADVNLPSTTRAHNFDGLHASNNRTRGGERFKRFGIVLSGVLVVLRLTKS
jgi:hypothetical protein